ncbi:MAG: tetratricopeptide repeat protein, partial [Gammaproteobacteria bacterium]
MSSSRIYLYVAFLAALILTLLAYLPGLHGPFVFDDITNIVQNKALAMHSLAWDQLMHAALSSDAGPTGRPLSSLSFALNIYFNGLDATAFKITNLVIHLLNGLLVFILLRQIVEHWSKKRVIQSANTAFWLPLLCAAAWLLHPLNLTAVLYVVQRETSLCSLF